MISPNRSSLSIIFLGLFLLVITGSGSSRGNSVGVSLSILRSVSESVPVSSNDANEVAISEVNPDGEEASPEEVVSLSGSEGPLGLWSDNNVVLLIDNKEVDDTPDGLSGV